MSDTTKAVPLSPAQRWVLFQLLMSSGKDLEVSGQEGRRLRRFVRSAHLDTIRDTLLAHRDRVNNHPTTVRTPVLVELTEENREYAGEVMTKTKRTVATELTLGDFWDALEDAKSEAYNPPALPSYDPASDLAAWVPASTEVSDLVDEIHGALAELGGSSSVEPLQNALRVLKRPMEY